MLMIDSKASEFLQLGRKIKNVHWLEGWIRLAQEAESHIPKMDWVRSQDSVHVGKSLEIKIILTLKTPQYPPPTKGGGRAHFSPLSLVCWVLSWNLSLWFNRWKKPREAAECWRDACIAETICMLVALQLRSIRTTLFTHSWLVIWEDTLSQGFPTLDISKHMGFNC